MNKKFQNSSYFLNNYEKVFRKICLDYKPLSILEIGILDGYSLNSFIKYASKETKILAIDLFENYQFKNSNYEEITKLFDKYENVKVKYGDFYTFFNKKLNFDIIHIDISNDGEIFDFAIKNYYPLANKLLILEGGSNERDNVGWMTKYQKPKINTYLKTLDTTYNFEIINIFPSMTIFYK